VLLVLELGGPAYETMRRGHAQIIANEEARLQLLADTGEAARLRTRMRSLVEEAEQATRLLVVDAGTDRARLRAQYPDRSVYAIVRGEVRAGLASRPGSPDAPGPDTASYYAGTVQSLAVETITVPLAFRGTFSSMRRRSRASSSAPLSNYSVKVAFGRRLEPWIIEATTR
jgi:hypothetical protein